MSQKVAQEVSIAYSGVHSIYHIAHAAYEQGILEQFYCSMIDAPGKFGRLLSTVVGPEQMVNRRRPELPSDKVTEYPGPLVRGMLGAKLGKSLDWFQINDQFDRWAAKKLKNSSSRVFVGMETCALHSFVSAKERGMKLVLDCPQVHPTFLENLLARAAEDLKLPQLPQPDIPEMAARKKEEFAMADQIIVLSEVEWRSYLEAGVEESRLRSATLWADPAHWFPPPSPKKSEVGPLKAIFVGRLELRKGIPYLLRAARLCGKDVQLTLVGSDSGQIDTFLKEYQDDFVYFPSQNKEKLREMYWNADVLVLPSLVDTFGFVAMEAMACGTPVIVSHNCGVPVPDESWRVPIMDAESVAEQLLKYARNRELCRENGQRAAEFATRWTAQGYRNQIGQILKSLLN